MANGIADNRAMKRHCISPVLVYWISLLFSTVLWAKSEFINVYIKLKPSNEITPLVLAFNQFLTQQQLTQKYQIKSFLQSHPLHLTLYLTHYQPEAIPKVLRRVKHIAQQTPPVCFTTGSFVVDKRAYVMLAVKNNQALQQLSNTVVNTLQGLRDKQAIIPAWAAHDQARVRLFKHYGSPGVFTLFAPHFSILWPSHLSVEQQKMLAQRLKTGIHQFISQQNSQRIAYAAALAVGIADQQGQIVKELAAFPLA